MKTNAISALLFAVALGWLLAAPCGPAPAAERPPNVVIILADDLGYGDVGFQGGKDVPTPHLDALAKSGTRCTSGYVSCPYCSPTRAGLLTGRYQQRFGHEFNPTLASQGGVGQGLAVGETTLANRFKAAGYATGLIGKWHLGEEPVFHPLARGFGEYYGFLTGAHSYTQSDDPRYGPIYRGRERVEPGEYLTAAFGREACAFIDRHRAEPFFLYLAFNAVHLPSQAPAALVEKFAHVADPLRRRYLAMVLALDDAVGAVVARLKAAGVDGNTLVVFLSDNGGPIGKMAENGSTNSPLRGSKGDTWEGGIRVPFVLSWPGRVPAGAKYDHPVIQLDLYPTALAVAGVTANPDWHLDGVNLLPYLTGERAGAPHDALYWRFGRQMAVRRGDWKLVRPDRAVKGNFGDIAPTPMLYDLAADIGERNDVTAAHADRVRAMQADWDRWNAGLIPPRWPATQNGIPMKP